MLPADSPLLEGLNDRQAQAVTSQAGALLIVAGAGSGKTSVLTRRIAGLIASKTAWPSQILAITFTNKAAGEMRERVAALVGEASQGMWISTFHSACVRILRTEAERFGYTKAFTIYDSGDQRALIKRLIRDHGADRLGLTPASVSGKMSRLKNELVDVDSYRGQVRESDPNDVAFYQLWSDYQAELARSQAFDFDDLIVHTVQLFRAFPEVAAVYRRRFRHILVDEYQDTNHAQYALIRELTQAVSPEQVPESAPPHERENGLEAPALTVVGDSDQSIYAFRGADIRNIVEFERDFPGAEVILLEQNYRSKQTILDAANAVISQNFDRKAKNLFSELGAGDKIQGFTGYSQHDEAQFVADEIGKLIDEGYRYQDIAVFYRTNAQTRAMEDVFIRQALPYRIIGGTKFYERAEIKDLLAYLHAIANPADALAVRRILNTPKRGIGPATEATLVAHAEQAGITLSQALTEVDQMGLGPKVTGAISELSQLLIELRSTLDSATAAETLKAVIDRTGYRTLLERSNDPQDLARVENVDELLGVASEFSRGNQDGGLVEFLTEVSLVAAADELDDSGGTVSLMTLHTAKGLEFDAVFVTGVEEELLPHRMSANEPGGLAEERRLFYVGMTRAKNKLHLSLAMSRQTFGEAMVCAPSRFLREIPEELMQWRDSGLGDRALTAPRTSLEREPRSLPRPPREKNTQWANRIDTVVRDNSEMELAVGDRITHDDFGPGTISALTGAGPKRVAEVRFDQVGKKRLLVKIAPISLTPGV
ncbi:DNA helicase PcrA [Pontimonas salivibrio]|uniref:DNA 3'-5' helicase n=1 Tax=Pontimonas salivibrio TaxID=1159327 RepID=A0A2L2BNY0_9MICO|nr:UvrD-helicase domain-containing protein [Pontimonas salivibrio]AVG23364.1 DNA helicase PcrA [Pontimonas salivibrio]